MQNTPQGFADGNTSTQRLARVERRLAGLVLALEAARRPAEKLAAEHILDDLKVARALRPLRRVA